MKLRTVIILIVMALLMSCAKTAVYQSSEEKLAKADEFYAKKKYARAAELYQDVYFERSTAHTAYALMRQADSYFALNKFAEARVAYEEFINAFPRHEDASTAMFQSALCMLEESLPAQYDQSETIAAINVFRRFIEKYPNDERYQQAIECIRKGQNKLIEKRYRNGYISYMMKDYSAALMYFDEVTDLGNEDEWDRLSLYYSAIICKKQDRREEAINFYQSLIQKYPHSKEAKKLTKKFAKY
ncbi:MAG TPA: outer membrane protein assembly factor BamD [Candidatus Cloacimonas sp.]|jgi:outer membrane protein assembly factor BamD|nr:outer membrane protein assembly factor BamD [Candidatus Cloacimonas sp.]